MFFNPIIDLSFIAIRVNFTLFTNMSTDLFSENNGFGVQRSIFFKELSQESLKN